MLHTRVAPDAVPVPFDEAEVLAAFPEASPALARLVAELRMTEAFLTDPEATIADDIRSALKERAAAVRADITEFEAETIADIGLKASVPRPGVIQRPDTAHSECYGLLVGEEGAGAKFPAGSTVIVEPVPPRARDHAVAYLVDRETPSIWHMGDSFTPEMLQVGEGSTVFPQIEMFAPQTGQRGHIDVRRFEKLHRIHSVFIPLDGSVVSRRLPDNLPILSETPEGCLEHRITDAANYPLLRQGDIALIDITKTDLRDGAICLLRWDGGSTSVVQTNYRTMGSAGLTWLIDPINRPGVDAVMKTGGILYASDGPYEAENLASKIIGEVVGILARNRVGRLDSVGIEPAGMRKISPAATKASLSVADVIEAHVLGREALDTAAVAADEVAVEQAGGDTSPEAMAPIHEAYEQASAAETAAWWGVVDVEPASEADLIKKLDYIATSPALRDGERYEYILNGISRNVQSLVVRRADAERNPLLDETPPDGFVAYPFDTPTSFVVIERMIPIEAARLLKIAERELSRRAAFHDGSSDVVDRLRRDLFIDTLTAMARREIAPPLPAGAEVLADPNAAAETLAAMTFDPVDRHSPCPIPNRADWIGDAETMLPWLRAGWLMLSLDKEALISHLDDETPEEFAALADELRRARRNLAEMYRVAATAQSRILIASAAASLRGSGANDAEA